MWGEFSEVVTDADQREVLELSPNFSYEIFEHRGNVHNVFTTQNSGGNAL